MHDAGGPSGPPVRLGVTGPSQIVQTPPCKRHREQIALGLVQVYRELDRRGGLFRPPRESQNLGEVRQCVRVGMEEVACLSKVDRFSRKLLGRLELAAARQDFRPCSAPDDVGVDVIRTS